MKDKTRNEFIKGRWWTFFFGLIFWPLLVCSIIGFVLAHKNPDKRREVDKGRFYTKEKFSKCPKL